MLFDEVLTFGDDAITPAGSLQALKMPMSSLVQGERAEIGKIEKLARWMAICYIFCRLAEWSGGWPPG